MKNYIILLLVIFSEFFSPGLSMSNEIVGFPFISRFTRHEYPGGAQTWSITQDERGVMYFANYDGVLEFDGYKWDLIEMPNKAIVRKVFRSKSGRIYIGAYNQFGYLTSNQNGDIVYRSISDSLLKAEPDFEEVWNIAEMPWGMVVTSFSSILIMNDNKLEILVKDESLNFSFKVDNRLLIGHDRKGLMEVSEEGLVPVAGGEEFVGKSISSILKTKKGDLLISTSFNGVYLYDGTTFSKWQSEIADECSDKQIYCGIQIKDNVCAYGTIKNGLYFFDSDGKILSNINRENGLHNNSVLSLHLDNARNLWVALDNGINYININSPVTHLIPQGMIGSGYVSCRDESRIYLGTNQSLFSIPWRAESKAFSLSEIKQIDGLDGQVWSIQDFDGHILCGAHSGVYEIIGDKVLKVVDILGGWKFLSPDEDSNYLIGGTYTGLILLKRNIGSVPYFEFVKELEGFDISCREMEFDNDGNLWVSHVQHGVYRIRFNEVFDEIIKVDFFNSEHGLPSDFYNSITKIKGKIFVSTKDGLYEYIKSKNEFKLSEKLANIIGRKKIDKFYEGDENDIWFFTADRLGVARTNFQGNYYSEILPFKELKGNFVKDFGHILPLGDDKFLISTVDGFSYFDKTKANDIDFKMQLLLRSVSSINGHRIFGGNFLDDNQHLISFQPEGMFPEIQHKHNNLRFEFSANAYSDQDKIQYRYRMEGFDQKWSDWSERSYIEYGGLPNGEYELHAVAQNEAMIESEEQIFRFKIRRPFFLEPFFLILYLIAFFLITFWMVSLVRKRIERERDILKAKQKEELDMQKSKHENERLRIEQEIIRLRNEKLNLENARNQAELENKSKELASIIMKISYTNDLINRTRAELVEVLGKMVHKQSKVQIQKLITKLENELNSDEDWDQFQVYFDSVHENFIQNLKNTYPSLTNKDLKLASYLRMNLTTKEIAHLYNLTPRGVETSRYRLRKKMGLGREVNLTDFLLGV